MLNLTIVLAAGSFWIPLIFGLVFLFYPLKQGFILQRYKVIKYLMSAIYLLFAAVSFVALLTATDFNYSNSIRVSIPLVAVFHIVLFSTANITLIHPKFYTLSRLVKGLLVALLFSVFYLASLIFAKESWMFEVSLLLLYLLLCVSSVYYGIIFFKEYKIFRLKVDNIFSESSTFYFTWIQYFQLMVLGFAAIVLVTPWLPDQFLIGFLTFLLVFYCFYAIRLIYLSINFLLIRDFFEHTEDSQDFQDKNTPVYYSQLEDAITQWVEKKKFTQTDITIVSVASELGTNRTYLSGYINTYKNCTFKEWIYFLRIEEAKRLMLENPSTPIGDIGALVGINDRSNFGRYFSKITGYTPCVWRTNNLKEIKS